MTESPFAPLRCYLLGSRVVHDLDQHYPVLTAPTASFSAAFSPAARYVANPKLSSYQNTPSPRWPAIVIEARSLPDTATTRLIGCWSFIQSPRVVARCWTNVPLGIARRTERGRLNTIDLVAVLGIEPLVGDDPRPARV